MGTIIDYVPNVINQNNNNSSHSVQECLTYLIVVWINLFHSHFGFIGVLRTLKLEYPDRTFRQVDNYESYIDEREHDEREIYDIPFQVNQTSGEQYTAREENAVQRQQDLSVRRVADFRHVHQAHRSHS